MEAESVIATNSSASRKYASELLKPMSENRFHKDLKNQVMNLNATSVNLDFIALTQGERDIVDEYQLSLDKLSALILGRFTIGESVIAKDAFQSHIYAREVLNGRFILGEDAIVQDDIWGREYTKAILCNFDGYSADEIDQDENLKRFRDKFVGDRLGEVERLKFKKSPSSTSFLQRIINWFA